MLIAFRSVPVFAVEATEGDPLPQTDDRYDACINELPLLEVAKSWGVVAKSVEWSLVKGPVRLCHFVPASRERRLVARVSYARKRRRACAVLRGR